MPTDLEILDWATAAAKAARSVLAGVNLALPGWLAQAIALVVLAGIAVALLPAIRGAWRKWSQEHSKVALTAAIASVAVATAATAAALAVPLAWAEELLRPQKHQLLARVQGPAAQRQVTLELLDWRGESMGASVIAESGSSVFLIEFQPEFADPPAALLARAPGCAEERVALRHAHLRRGAVVVLQPACPEEAP